MHLDVTLDDVKADTNQTRWKYSKRADHTSLRDLVGVTRDANSDKSIKLISSYRRLEYLSFCITQPLHDGRESCYVGLKRDLFWGILLAEQSDMETNMTSRIHSKLYKLG